MTIIVSVATKNAFVFGSESRQVIGDDNWLKSFQQKDYTNRNFKIQPGEFPKTFLLGGQYAVNYSGVGFYENWSFEAELNELEEMSTNGRYGFYDLAKHLNDKIVHAAGDRSFDLHMAGFPGGRPVWAESNDRGLVFYKKDEVMGRVATVGMVDIIEKTLKDEMVDFQNMTLKDVVEFVWLTIITGSKYLEYLVKYPAVSGGPVNILALTPNGHEIFKLPAFGLPPRKGGISI